MVFPSCTVGVRPMICWWGLGRGVSMGDVGGGMVALSPMGAMLTLLLVILHPAVPASKVSFCTFQYIFEVYERNLQRKSNQTPRSTSNTHPAGTCGKGRLYFLTVRLVLKFSFHYCHYFSIGFPFYHHSHQQPCQGDQSIERGGCVGQKWVWSSTTFEPRSDQAD